MHSARCLGVGSAEGLADRAGACAAGGALLGDNATRGVRGPHAQTFELSLT